MVAEARAGNWKTAKRMAEAKSVNEPNAATWIVIARAYAAASMVEDAPQDKLKEEAVMCIKRAVAIGFSDPAELIMEPDFASIRERQDFQSLIEQVESNRTK